MDIDVAPAPDFHEQADEDLIDYDEDAFQGENLDPNGHDVDTNVFDHDVAEPTASTVNEMEMNYASSVMDFADNEAGQVGSINVDLESGMLDAEAMGDATMGDSHEYGADADALVTTDDHIEDVDLDAGEQLEARTGAKGSALTADIDESMHEIDYELQEVYEASQENTGGEADQNEAYPAIQEEDFGDESHQQPQSEQKGEEKGEAEANDITWEETEHDENTDISKGETDAETAEPTGDHNDAEFAEQNDQIEEPVDTEAHYEGESALEQDAGEGREDNDEFLEMQEKVSEVTEAAPENEETAIASKDDATDGDAVHEDEDDSYHGEQEWKPVEEHNATEEVIEEDGGQQKDSQLAEKDFPKVTVHYRGDEYPMFSTTSDGFFTEDRVLDDSLEVLMAGLRDELASEVAADEEIVLQIDELGLEIVESHLRESLTGITLRQILEIFDLLVKNQDPDSSRILYAYLFTRPNASKRFDFLAESAAAGKGLDEVIHLYDAPVVPSLAVAEDGTDGHSHGDEDDDIETPTVAERNDNAAADGQGESNLADDDHHVAETVSHDEAAPENAYNGTDIDGNDNVEHASHEAAAMPVVEVNEVEDNIDVGSYEDHEEEEAPGVDPTSPYLDLEVGNVDEPQQDQHSKDEDGIEYAEEGDEQTNSGLTTTSTTNTLDHDLESEAIPHGEPSELQENGSTAQDDLDEIDWRDEEEIKADAAADAAASAEESASTSGKRAHIDAELDTEDENDAKRLRS